MRIFISISIFYALLFSEAPIALVTKVRGDIKYKNIVDNKFIKTLEIASPIYLESQILVDKKAFTKLVFLDDGSTLSIYPETEILIKGYIEKRKITKEIELIYGQINIDAIGGTDYKFITIAPSSELSCSTCNFWLLSNQKIGDQFIKENGELNILNPSTDQNFSLGLDTTLISLIDNDFKQYKSTVNELKYLESLMLEFDEILIGNSDKNKDISKTIANENIVVIKLKNAANVEKEIVLRYTK